MGLKGVVLAGGTGSRLRPLTLVTNKHLLPVYDQPMVYYPIQMLVDAGITEIMVVTGGESAGDFIQLLGNGEDVRPRTTWSMAIQERGRRDRRGARAHAATSSARDDSVVVVLGDNILAEPGRADAVQRFREQDERSTGPPQEGATTPNASASPRSTDGPYRHEHRREAEGTDAPTSP